MSPPLYIFSIDFFSICQLATYYFNNNKKSPWSYCIKLRIYIVHTLSHGTKKKEKIISTPPSWVCIIIPHHKNFTIILYFALWKIVVYMTLLLKREFPFTFQCYPAAVPHMRMTQKKMDAAANVTYWPQFEAAIVNHTRGGNTQACSNIYLLSCYHTHIAGGHTPFWGSH